LTGLGENILSLGQLRKQREQTIANLAEPLRLTLVAPKGPNPGELRMLTYIPPGLSDGAPLVVVLHGCTQNAAAYDHGAGWSTLAQHHGFALLFPEQQRSNNAQLCFNWFQPEDTERNHGEVESIRQMVLQTVTEHRLNPQRVYITGLSAGGAMTSAMLATAPELFAGGAIIAGIPYGAAAGMGEAFQAMRNARHRTAKEWGDLVRAASPHQGPRPAVQIWQGLADDTVHPGNAESLMLQWSNALGLPLPPSAAETVDGAHHETWRDANTRTVLERWTVPNLAHGTPIMTGGTDVDHAVGFPGPHMLAGGIASTWHIAHSWGLLTQAARTRAEPTARAAAARTAAHDPTGVASVIDTALRAAGLLR
jgi:poly(hydroxyalkanoate) depolymerase family esterase